MRLAAHAPWMTGTLVYSRVFWDLDLVGLRDQGWLAGSTSYWSCRAMNARRSSSLNRRPDAMRSASSRK